MRILGFDPGGKSVGHALLDVTGGHGRPIVATFVAGGSVSAKPSALAPLFAGVDVFAVEKIEHAFGGASGFIATSLIAAAYVAGIAVGMACHRGIRTIEIPAVVWRKMLCGKHNAGDDLVKERVGALIRSMPRRSSTHARDAMGTALAAAWAIGGERNLAARLGPDAAVRQAAQRTAVETGKAMAALDAFVGKAKVGA